MGQGHQGGPPDDHLSALHAGGFMHEIGLQRLYGGRWQLSNQVQPASSRTGAAYRRRSRVSASRSVSSFLAKQKRTTRWSKPSP